MPPQRSAYDYIIIGSGAAGGTVAARLAEAGMRVLVIEAGPDPLASGSSAAAHYSVPAFHALASEEPEFCWNQLASHFDEQEVAQLDGKSLNGRLLYPRAGALGGCTAHNAMIFLVPPDDDWDALASETGDRGWSAEAMSQHRKTVEQCRHRPIWRLLARFGIDPTGHGWNGWLPVEKALPMRALSDSALIRALFLTGLSELRRKRGLSDRLRAFVHNWGDPNDARRNGQEQLCYLPIATERHARSGARERQLQASPSGTGCLEIRTDHLATKVLFESGRAVGVEWLEGRHLYRASPKSADQAQGKVGYARASKEVILAGGAFATPQLLMLSGIGDPEHLRSVGLKPVVPLPDVGRNLQDRYEIGVVHRMERPWRSLRGATFSTGDPLYRKWKRFRTGMYSSNGTAIAALRSSSHAQPKNPDLALMGLMGRFAGYFPGYAQMCWPGLDGFSWAILKGQTQNRAGTVTLESDDPRQPPNVAFRNFEQQGDRDLDSLVEGVDMVRAMVDPLIACGAIAEEEIPGRRITGKSLRNWIRANAWGHHACGTAAIGPVLDSRGRVKGVEGLRVVDASIFPKIPGLFIVSAIYLAAEKLARDILADARRGENR